MASSSIAVSARLDPQLRAGGPVAPPALRQAIDVRERGSGCGRPDRAPAAAGRG